MDHNGVELSSARYCVHRQPINAALRLHYHLGRLPLQFVEEHVLTGMASESPARRLYDRALGAVHVTVGQVLCDPKLKQHGEVLMERSATLGP
jgi:hypothetical protein